MWDLSSKTGMGCSFTVVQFQRILYDNSRSFLFASTVKKNRINFLKCLQGSEHLYLLDQTALSCLSHHKMYPERRLRIAEFIKDADYYAFTEKDLCVDLH
jgi:hypothetical protein